MTHFTHHLKEYVGNWLQSTAVTEVNDENDEHIRAKRALQCSDRPKFDCKRGKLYFQINLI